MFVWNEEMIRYMDRAASHTQYYKTLAGLIGQDLKKTDRICDMGCGLGYLSLALSPYVAQVDAVDISHEALTVLTRNLTAPDTGVSNVFPIMGDFYTMEIKKTYDAMIFCYFAQAEAILKQTEKVCRGPIYIIKGRSSRHLFSRNCEKTSRENAGTMIRWLNSKDIPFEAVDLDLEFGQPFNSMADMEAFAKLYGKRMVDGRKDTSWIYDRLGPDPDGVYPLYMPLKKPVTLFRIYN